MSIPLIFRLSAYLLSLIYANYAWHKAVYKGLHAGPLDWKVELRTRLTYVGEAPERVQSRTTGSITFNWDISNRSQIQRQIYALLD